MSSQKKEHSVMSCVRACPCLRDVVCACVSLCRSPSLSGFGLVMLPERKEDDFDRRSW